jgi:hypothetical protein
MATIGPGNWGAGSLGGSQARAAIGGIVSPFLGTNWFTRTAPGAGALGTAARFGMSGSLGGAYAGSRVGLAPGSYSPSGTAKNYASQRARASQHDKYVANEEYQGQLMMDALAAGDFEEAARVSDWLRGVGAVTPLGLYAEQWGI